MCHMFLRAKLVAVVVGVTKRTGRASMHSKNMTLFDF